MKRFLLILAAVLVVSTSALAGDIPSGGFAPPPPPPTTGATSTPAPGEVPNVGSAQSTQVDAVIQGVLNFLGGLVP